MSYKPLPYEQYFIDTSEDFNNTGMVRRKICYTPVTYTNRLARILNIRHEANYEVYYEAERDVIQINFQRTMEATDWIANVVEFGSRYYSSIDFEGQKLQLRVHHGWGDMYKSIKGYVRELWSREHEAHPDAVTEIIGWSLGSGLAILCAQDLNYKFGLKPYLYTFGSVRPFRYTPRNKALMKRYMDSLCTVCLNFADINDIISYMPPFYGFTMPNRVDLALDQLRLRRILHPLKYHTDYDRAMLYGAFETGQEATGVYAGEIHEAGEQGTESAYAAAGDEAESEYAEDSEQKG